MADTTYIITATHPDGRPYRDNLSKALDGHSVVKADGIAAYGEKDRADRERAIRAAGLTPHVRKA